ncbi:MAG TPA: DUF5808 domain-containing protein [Mucilaginibacter sp.]|nr:DUF5808 domain-containing protein [Mucilaginibacter sp.]
MEPIDNPANYKWGVFYFNKNDIRTIVPKRVRAFGWTLNFAHWGSYAFMVAIVLIVLLFTGL